MAAKTIPALCVVAACLAVSTTAQAQDFHIETTTYAVIRPEPRELARTLTLFHAGRTYDFIQGLGELIVFEPSRGQFTLVNTQQQRAAVVHVDEIKHILQIARQALENHLQAVNASGKPEARELAEKILFQFNPQFDPAFTQENNQTRLDLTSKHFHYSVLCAAPPAPELGQAYLNYADWICRLNYVLQPTAILPDQRIVLDSILRKNGLIPVEVTFADHADEAVQIRAQHRIYWSLNDHDRELIRQWDSLLTRRDLKRVSFKEYQQSLLLSQLSRRK